MTGDVSSTSHRADGGVARLVGARRSACNAPKKKPHIRVGLHHGGSDFYFTFRFSAEVFPFRPVANS
jgi:hypothetical protein